MGGACSRSKKATDIQEPTERPQAREEPLQTVAENPVEETENERNSSNDDSEADKRTKEAQGKGYLINGLALTFHRR